MELLDVFSYAVKSKQRDLPSPLSSDKIQSIQLIIWCLDLDFTGTKTDCSGHWGVKDLCIKKKTIFMSSKYPAHLSGLGFSFVFFCF